MNKRLSVRLQRLEALAQTKSGRSANVLFLDHQDRILWDGSEAMKGWASRHSSEWPADWLDRPWPITLVGGVDPLVVLGLLSRRKSSEQIARGSPSAVNRCCSPCGRTDAQRPRRRAGLPIGSREMPFDPSADSMPDLEDAPHLRVANWRCTFRFLKVAVCSDWLEEIAQRVEARIPPVTGAEFAELAE